MIKSYWQSGSKIHSDHAGLYIDDAFRFISNRSIKISQMWLAMGKPCHFSSPCFEDHSFEIIESSKSLKSDRGFGI